MNRKGLALILAVFLGTLATQACSRPQSPEPSCNFVQNPEQQRVSWQKHLPIKLYVHESVPSSAYAAIDRAINEYNQKLGGGQEIFRIIARNVGGDLNPRKDGTSMIYWFTSWDPNRDTEQARTTIYWSGTEIFEADIRINADPDNFSYYYGEDSNISGVDLMSLLVHELGHVLGLAHNATSGSVMNFTLDNGQERRKLGELDLTSLKCEY